MEFSTRLPHALGDLNRRLSASLTPFNDSASSGDLLRAGPGSNGTAGAEARDAAGLVIAVCITALYSLICVVGLLGNVLVMYGVVR